MQTHSKLSLIDHFKDLPDPRVPGRCDHDLIDVLVIAVCTLLCGGRPFQDGLGLGAGVVDARAAGEPLRGLLTCPGAPVVGRAGRDWGERPSCSAACGTGRGRRRNESNPGRMKAGA